MAEPRKIMKQEYIPGELALLVDVLNPHKEVRQT